MRPWIWCLKMALCFKSSQTQSSTSTSSSKPLLTTEVSPTINLQTSPLLLRSSSALPRGLSRSMWPSSKKNRAIRFSLRWAPPVFVAPVFFCPRKKEIKTHLFPLALQKGGCSSRRPRAIPVLSPPVRHSGLVRCRPVSYLLPIPRVLRICFRRPFRRLHNFASPRQRLLFLRRRHLFRHRPARSQGCPLDNLPCSSKPSCLATQYFYKSHSNWFKQVLNSLHRFRPQLPTCRRI